MDSESPVLWLIFPFLNCLWIEGYNNLEKIICYIIVFINLSSLDNLSLATEFEDQQIIAYSQRSWFAGLSWTTLLIVYYLLNELSEKQFLFDL